MDPLLVLGLVFGPFTLMFLGCVVFRQEYKKVIQEKREIRQQQTAEPSPSEES